MAAKTAQLVDFTLPSLGSDMEEGTILTWLVEVGDQVAKGDVLLRVDTEKAEIDVEVWHEAVIAELLVGPGEIVQVGSAIARLETGAPAQASAPEPASPAALPPAAQPTAPTPAPEPAVVVTSAKKERPAAPRTVTAQTNGAGVQATPRLVYWPTEAVVDQSRDTPTAAAEPTQTRAQRRQAAVAALMDRSNREIPHFHLVREIDLTDVLEWLDGHNDQVPPTERVLPAALLLYAVANAAAGTVINGTLADGPVDADQVDLGVAVHVRGGGLITPVLPAAQKLTLDELMGELQELVGRTRSNRLNTRDMTNATLTVTNLGDSGADRVLGVIRPPQRALVGFGRIAERAFVVDGAVMARSTVEVTLSADHRVVNGQAGARFLETVNTILSTPDEITLMQGAS